MGTKETRLERGRRLGRGLTAATVTRLRDQRLTLGVSQAQMAASLGISQQHYSRIERLESHVSLVTASEMASFLGLEPSLTLHPAGPPIRDRGHEALIARFMGCLAPTWRVVRQAPFPSPGDQRSWDALLRRGHYLIGVEAETRIRDLQELVRRMRERVRSGGADEVLLALSASATNRRLAGQLRAALGEPFTTPPRETLRALRLGLELPGSGVVLL